MAQGAGGGRPTKLNRKLIAEFEGLLRSGNYVETACAVVGITKQTFYNWMRRGQAAQRRTNLHWKFFDITRRALAESEATAVDRLNGLIAHADTDQAQIKAIIEFLSRRFPARWSTRQVVGTVEIPEEDGTGSPNYSALSTEDMERILAIMTAARSKQPTESEEYEESE